MNGMTSGCVRTVLFLTDGKDKYNFKPSELHQLDEVKDVNMLTYSFGKHADTRIPKQLACQFGGIWYHVEDSMPIETIMAKYYMLFANGIDDSSVRWYQYTDVLTNTPLLAGCLPVYDRSQNVAKLVGVSCIDINIIVSLDTLWKKPSYLQMQEKMDSITQKCPTLKYGQGVLQHIRLQESVNSVCKQCDMSDEGCPTTTTTTAIPGFLEGKRVNGARTSAQGAWSWCALVLLGWMIS